ncbi:hypothetical protein L1887_30319 [Cichorium endivia]|nr:hypothetical protein L1887_30319 [Cichorium endivia]
MEDAISYVSRIWTREKKSIQLNVAFVGTTRWPLMDPIIEATSRDEYHVAFFPNAIWSANEDGHNIIQYVVINRSENVYNLLYQMSDHKSAYRTIKDSFENNLLHLAARLAPTNKLDLISG